MKSISLQGHIPYSEGEQRMLELVEERRLDRIADTVLFLEHEPIVTVGRGGPSLKGATPVSRGGEATWHGPGQLVAYPIFRIRSVLGFLRHLELSVIQALTDFTGLPPGTFLTREGLTGVWTREGKKIASIGIAVRHWVSYHGVAMNVVNDLTPFYDISPCGLNPAIMTRLKDLVSTPADWRPRLESSFINALSISESQTRRPEGPLPVSPDREPEFGFPPHRETRSQSQALEPVRG